jgi:hypothetical protein
MDLFLLSVDLLILVASLARGTPDRRQGKWTCGLHGALRSFDAHAIAHIPRRSELGAREERVDERPATVLAIGKLHARGNATKNTA